MKLLNVLIFLSLTANVLAQTEEITDSLKVEKDTIGIKTNCYDRSPRFNRPTDLGQAMLLLFI